MAQVAKRYAKAMFKVMKDRTQDPKKYLNKIRAIESLYQIPESGKILRSPVMPADLKLQLLNYGLNSVEADSQLSEFLEYLVTNRREGLLPKIFEAFRNIIDESEGVIRGVVTTAVEMADEEKEAISVALGNVIQKKVILDTRIDTDILGGFVAHVGQFLVDQSLRTKLNEMGQFVTQRATHS